MALTYETFDVNRIIFENVTMKSAGKIQFQRIPIKYKYPNGKIDKLSLKTSELMTWGIQENREQSKQSSSKEDEGPIQAYSMGIVMYDKSSGASDEETKTIEMFESILRKVKEHLKRPKSLLQFVDPVFIDAIKIFHRPREANGEFKDVPPTLYPKLFTIPNKSGDPMMAPKITTGFWDCDNQKVNPSTLMGTRCKIIADIFVDNIYIGGSSKPPSIQFKLNDVLVMDMTERRRNLFAPLKPEKLPTAASMYNEDDEVQPSIHHQDEPDDYESPVVTMVKRRT